MMSDTVLVALFAAVPATLTALGALIVSIRNGRKIDVVADGMQAAMIAAKEVAAAGVGRAEQVAAERTDERARSVARVLQAGADGRAAGAAQERANSLPPASLPDPTQYPPMPPVLPPRGGDQPEAAKEPVQPPQRQL